MAQTTPIARVKFRGERAERDWRALVPVVQEAAKQPGYAGPSPALVERVHADMLALLASLDPWRATVGPRNRRRTATPRATFPKESC